MENQKEKNKIKIKYLDKTIYYEIQKNSDFNDLIKFCENNFEIDSFTNYFLENNYTKEIINTDSNFSTLIDAYLLLKDKRDSFSKKNLESSQHNNEEKKTNETKHDKSKLKLENQESNNKYRVKDNNNTPKGENNTSKEKINTPTGEKNTSKDNNNNTPTV